MSSVNVDSKSVGSAAARPAADAYARTDDIVIGLGVRTAGKFQTAGSIFVDGALGEADVECSSLSISRGGEFHGSAKAARVEVSGSLAGEAIASEEIVLRASAVVTGKISAPYIVVHRGACVTGEVNSVERRSEPTKPLAAPPPFTKYRPKRGLHLFMASVAIGLVLSGGAALAWLRGDQNAEAGPATQMEVAAEASDQT